MNLKDKSNYRRFQTITALSTIDSSTGLCRSCWWL
uniref:Uncharacterized protein n=1 Tax=Arundo donax TaxID=35708 RepID=A0A0A9AG03_ARUDO